MDARMRVLLITDLTTTSPFGDASKVDLAATLAPLDVTEERVRAHSPDIVVATLRTPNTALFREIKALDTVRGVPVVYIDHADDPCATTSRLAAEAGVTAYIPARYPLTEFPALLNWAQIRFAALRATKKQLADAEKKLSDRIVIERAKGLMMKIQGIAEETAYRELRSLSMRRAVPMRVTAQSILDACGHTPGS